MKGSAHARLRFVAAAILAPTLSWLVVSPAPNHGPRWLIVGIELGALFFAVFVISLIVKDRTGAAAAVGLGATFGLAALFILVLGIAGVNACGGRHVSSSACPKAPVRQSASSLKWRVPSSSPTGWDLVTDALHRIEVEEHRPRLHRTRPDAILGIASRSRISRGNRRVL